ncbi:MAG: hypothetical protein WB809_02275 [Thermoplasmata archaeon]
MSRVVTLYLVGIVVVVVLLSIGLALDEPAAATAAVVVALTVGLLALLPQLLSANGNRYAEHKDYFASVLLPQVGGMQLVGGDGVVFLHSDRIAWKLRDNRVPTHPGMGEPPYFDDMLRPHLTSGNGNRVWEDLKGAFFVAQARVEEYTRARRKFDSEFIGKMERMIREAIGDGYRAVWGNERARDFMVAQSKYAAPTYSAGNFRSPCLLWYEGRFQSDVGMRWEQFTPVAEGENPAQGVSWRVKVGEGDGRDYLWGGEVPSDIAVKRTSVEAIIDALRLDEGLKQLYLKSLAEERVARDSLQSLPVLADYAVSLLRHGPDIPGVCEYCAGWSPRL